MGIPPWNTQGVLPPIGVVDPTSLLRSPYAVPLNEVVVRFGTSDERLTILDGLLQYRANLQALGLVRGFQWLDGSFLENIEGLEARSPNDIDVVTFYRLPPGETQVSIAQRAAGLLPNSLADLQSIRLQFHVDAYAQCLDVTPETVVRASTYWYSMWSHRRDDAWKGYVQVDLAPIEDIAASSALASLTAAGAQP